MSKSATADVYRISSSLRVYPWGNKLIPQLKLPKIPKPIDPFEISFEECLGLSLEEAEKLRRRTLREKREWIEERCKERDVDWIVVCGGEIVLSGKGLKELPEKEKLKEIGERYNKIPFLFFSTDFGPEIEEGTAWHKTEIPTDYYPTIKIVVSGEKGKREIVSTFDTGSWITFLDIDKLVEEDILSLDHLDILLKMEKGRFAGKPYEFIINRVKISIIDESDKRESTEIPCRCVRNWRNSPFWENYPNREALIGRDILLNFPIKVELNGKEKKTYIYLVEQNG